MAEPFHGTFGALTVDAHRAGDRLQVVVAGELDVDGVHPLRDVVARYVQDDRCDVYVDCRGLTFIDSSGLGLFVKLHKRLAGARCELVLVGLNAQCRRVFEITGLTEFLHIE